MAKSGERLVCDIPADAKELITEYALSLSVKKGNMSKAYRELLALAYATPDAPVRKFDGDDETCTLEAKISEVPPLTAYQRHHRIGERRRGFRDALLRGLSIHLDSTPAQPVDAL